MGGAIYRVTGRLERVVGRLTRGSASQGVMPAEMDNTAEEGLEGTRVEMRRPILRPMSGLGLRA